MSRNSDATRVRDETYMYVRLCRVASRVPCDPTTGAAALLVASSPLIPPAGAGSLGAGSLYFYFWRFILSEFFFVIAPTAPTTRDTELEFQK